MNIITDFDQQLMCQIVIWLGSILAGIGMLKISFWVVGELFPGVWERKIQSPGLKRFLTGSGNRIVFGIGGILTLLFGLASVGLALLLQRWFAS